MQESNNFNITAAAANKIYELIAAEDNFDLKLRIYIVGGGCSGFQYGFAFDGKVNEDDFNFCTVVESSSEKITVIIDSLSMQYLTGGTLDYVDNLQGAHFKISNPNAMTTCGCGASFSV